MDGRPPGLIITADDFGLHTWVNMAVERAYREGVLSAASLMVAAPGAADAVARARANPGLRVGLHLVLADGRAMLPPSEVPDLVDGAGTFGSRMVHDGVRFFFLSRVRRQLAAEIRAQFEAFAATSLPLDHANAHKHFHLHPTVLSLMIETGREFGLKAIRLPREAHVAPLLRPWLALLQRRLRASGIAHNDYLVGLHQSGHFDESALLAALGAVPSRGLGEIYLHPATRAGVPGGAPGYRNTDELAALVSPRVRDACERLRAQGFGFGGFADLAVRP